MRLAFVALLLILATPAFAQTGSLSPAAAKPAPKMTRAQVTAVELQKTVDQLTQSNRDLLDLLKKQQAVLEDIQYDRRLQSRQIASLEERLESTLIENTQLQAKVAKLEAQGPSSSSTPSGGTDADTHIAPLATPPVLEPEPPPSPPSSYLPEAGPIDAPPGTLCWHRLFTQKGTNTTQTNLFQIRGRTWRVFWHNLDKPGKAYTNTSALFINAFPKDDTIPQKVCAKLGSGGESTELMGPGNYYLKVEASGGAWELAVEDFR